MALKALMLKKDIEKRRAALAALEEAARGFAVREKEIEILIDEAETEEERTVVSETIDSFEAEKAGNREQASTLLREIEGLERELAGLETTAEDTTETENNPACPEEERKQDHMYVSETKMNSRALDRIGAERRDAMLAREDVKAFLTDFRALSQKRALSGAELTIPDVLVEVVRENSYQYSKLLPHVNARRVHGTGRVNVIGAVTEAVWTEMCAAINEIDLGISQVSVDGFKVAAYMAVCNAVMEDSDMNLAAEIVEALSKSIGMATDKAILYGRGPAGKMPMGILTRLAQASMPDDYSAKAPVWKDLHESNILSIDADLNGAEFWAALTLALGVAETSYSTGDMFWAMSTRTYQLLKAKALTITASGDVAASIYNTLPVISGNIVKLDFMPEGDIVGGYGDLYLWAHREGMKIDRSDEVQFLQDNTVFRGKERADGVPVIAEAFVALNIKGVPVTTTAIFAADRANDALLDSLKLGNETLSPAFDAKKLSYTVTASAASAVVEATTKLADAQVAIEYDGKNVRNGGSVTWTADGTAHPLTVRVIKGNAKLTYTVSVTKSRP